MMSNLEKATKRIQELVPDIMELKFGCRVKEGIIVGRARDIVNEEDVFLVFLDGYCDLNNTIVCKSVVDEEIFGRDISLEDVLVAIEKIKKDDWSITVQWFAVGFKTKEPPVWHIQIRHDKGGMGADWKLNTPLHLQSEETIEFIYKLIDND